jgi:palmitoyl-protein thioesterase
VSADGEAGVFGIPNCPADTSAFCEASRRLIDLGAYLPVAQNKSVQAQYWQDPFNEDEYRAKNHFLPDINNDGSFNQTYKDNMLKVCWCSAFSG